MKTSRPYTFAGLPEIPLKDARFVVLQVPYEATVSYQTGTKFGPEGVLLASRALEFYDEELRCEPCEAGIKTLPPLAPESAGPAKMVREVAKAAAGVLAKDKILVGIGGEHSVSAGFVAAYRKQFPGLRVLHLDAHADMRDEYEGTPWSHACAARRMLDTGCSVSSVGIRSISREEVEFMEKEKPALAITWAHEMKAGWEERLAASLPGGTYFLSIDVDFFDPAVVPDTGTPEPGGFFWGETLAFLRAVINRKDISVVGFDVVELAPRSHFSPSCYFVARLVYKLIGCLYVKTGRQLRP